ncbi:MAG TPA: CHAD domain-containing protein [Polyangiaceae bacterium]|nr:CHAD domain-containing protein [Polyangiaceae bacterium]
MTLSAYVKPRLLALNEELVRAVPRVVAGDDGEAVHDLRVALRKLRSVLRVVRRLYGRFHADAVRAGFKRVADATGALRDEEVLAETLSGLELSPRAREALAAWLRARHARRERKLRRDVAALVGGGALDAPSAMLAALLTLPADPARDRPAARFARKIVFGALDDIERAQPVDPADAAGLHDLRILYKRLRYAVDAFAGVLPPEFSALERAAAAFQKRLGTIHDLDVALDVVEGAEGLPPEAGAEILEALTKARVRQIEKYERERARGVAPDKDAADRDEKAALKHAALHGAALKGARKADSKGEGKGARKADGKGDAKGDGKGARQADSKGDGKAARKGEGKRALKADGKAMLRGDGKRASFKQAPASSSPRNAAPKSSPPPPAGPPRGAGRGRRARPGPSPKAPSA